MSRSVTSGGPRLLRALFLIAVAAPGIGQIEEQPYFSLSSVRTFASNTKPSVAYSASKVDALEFRVYRINDPVKFFEQLDDPHQFGGRAPRPPHERTMIERIHAWKRSLRVSIRLALRGQFTESPSAHFKSIFPRESKPVSRETHFAEAPVLNSQQLVLSFVQPVRSARRWEAQNVDIGVHEKGVYLVEAVRGDLRAYTVLMVSDIVMITTTGRSGIMTFVVDRSTGEPIPDAEVSMLTREGEPAHETNTIKTNADGIAELPVKGGRAENLRVLTRSGADVAFTVPNFYYGVDREQWSGYIYTDRPVYRPGHTVHFKAIFRLRGAVGYQVPSARNVSIEIKDSEQKSIYRKALNTSANGTIQDELALAPLTALGSYYIEARGAEYIMSGSFEVEEYKKPEYEVRVTPSKSRVLQGESVNAVIEARYYFGEPVSGAKVKYAVYRSRYWFPLWYEPDDEQPEQGEGEGDERFGGENEQVLEADGQLDQDGKLNIQIPTTESDHTADYRYRIDARGTDQATRESAG